MTWSNFIIDKPLKDRREFQVGHRQEKQAKRGNSEIDENVLLEERAFLHCEDSRHTCSPKMIWGIIVIGTYPIKPLKQKQEE